MKKNYITGIVCAALGSIFFGLNPFFGLPLYAEGMTPLPVLFYRFSFASILMALYMLVCKKSFKLSRRYFLHITGAGILMALTCLFWFFTFRIMDSGISATILSVYPVMVALAMFIFYKERMSTGAVAGMLLAVAGVAILCSPDTRSTICARGVFYIFMSALSYTVYIIAVQKSRLKELSPETLTFYALLISVVVFFAALRLGTDIQMLPSLKALGCAIGLGLVPSLLAFLLTAIAIHHIGPTGTSVLGALDPIAAVLVGVFFFNENMTAKLVTGIILTLTAVTIVVCAMAKPAKQSC